jgi:hypothetical protein
MSMKVGSIVHNSGPMVTASTIGASVIADPRVKDAVEDIGDQVEHHDSTAKMKEMVCTIGTSAPRIAEIS